LERDTTGALDKMTAATPWPYLRHVRVRAGDVLSNCKAVAKGIERARLRDPTSGRVS